MKWYLKFWWHNFWAARWKKIASERRTAMVVAETYQIHHEGEWMDMKRRLKDFK